MLLCGVQVLELDLSTVVPSLSGPKRPHDRVSVSDMKNDFKQCLQNKVWIHHMKYSGIYMYMYMYTYMYHKVRVHVHVHVHVPYASLRTSLALDRLYQLS